MTATLCELFSTSARRFPNSVLVHDRGKDWTYGEVWSHAMALASWLREHGFDDGQRAALLVPNNAEYIVCYFGILLAGGTVVALDPNTTSRELLHTLVHGEPSALIASPRCERHLRALANELGSVRIFIRLSDNGNSLELGQHVTVLSKIAMNQANDFEYRNPEATSLAQIIYTSGTTGQPKGIMLSHVNLWANCQSITQYLRLRTSDAGYAVLPFFYSYGNSVLLTHIAVGARLVLAPDFVFWNRGLDLMEQQGATGLSGVPTTFAMLLSRSNFAERRFRTLRYLTCAGGALPPAFVKRLRQGRHHAKLFLMYGQTEGAARLSTLMPEDLDRKPGSIGKGIPGVQLEVLNDKDEPVGVDEVGEIVARGRNIMLGYWKDPEATRRVLRPEGLRTGDMARIDADGYIYIVGRRSDIIKAGAYRVSPQEIESVILEVEGLAEAAVVGQPDDIMGELIVAFVVLAPGHEPYSEESIIRHCAELLPSYKCVRRVYTVDSLPKTSSGKIKYAVLRAQLG